MKGLEEEQLHGRLRWGGGQGTAGRRAHRYECSIPKRRQKVLYDCCLSLRAYGGIPERKTCTEGLRDADYTVVLVICHLLSAALGAGGVVCPMEMPRHRGGGHWPRSHSL